MRRARDKLYLGLLRVSEWLFWEAMTKLPRLFGVLLIAVGAYGYWASGSGSMTALIPAYFGIGLIIAGLLAKIESMHKHAMHLAALLGLLGAIGAGMRLPKSFEAWQASPETASLAFSTQFAMFSLCTLFFILCLMNFVKNRRAKAALAA